MSKSPKIIIKRGDDFRLDMTIQDLNNDTAVAAYAAQLEAQAAYEAALIVVPLNQPNIDAALLVYTNAQAAYQAAILVNITTWTITSKIAWSGRLVDTLTVVKLDAPAGKFSIQAPETMTALWKPRPYEADIQFLRAEGKISSQTFEILVERDITNG